MKIKLLILTTLLLLSCSNSEEINNILYGNKKSFLTSFVKNIETIEYDSCEYLIEDLGTSHTVFTHKGNCKFCIERKIEQYEKR
jgi:hypothetical protein